MTLPSAEMTVTVLGSSASAPDAGDACSGFLVRQGETQILLDCGSGVLGNLRQVTTFEQISAIVISHFHPDHFLDLIPLRYGLRYGFGEPLTPRLLVPPGGEAYLAGIGQALRNNPHFFNHAYAITEYDPGATVAVDDLELSFQRTTHDEPTWACAVKGAHRFVYTSDTQESAEVEHFAAHADLLVCESTYPAADGIHTDGSANHLTSHQAGVLAKNARASQLMLTHFWPGLDRTLFQEEAERAFEAPVILARPGLTVPVASSSGSTLSLPRQEIAFHA